MNVRVFIQNEADSNQKHYHDEKTLEWKRVTTVSNDYPFPYGFIIGTSAEDGCNVDCFVLTREPLRTGDIVECRIVGLMEQFEDGEEDHNVLAVPRGEPFELDQGIRDTLSNFVTGVFRHIPGKRVVVGRFAGADIAVPYVTSKTDSAE